MGPLDGFKHEHISRSPLSPEPRGRRGYEDRFLGPMEVKLLDFRPGQGEGFLLAFLEAWSLGAEKKETCRGLRSRLEQGRH